MVGGKRAKNKLSSLGFIKGKNIKIFRDDGGPIIIGINNDRIALGRGIASKVLVLDIINSTNLERNLYFTIQLLEMGVDLIAVLNMAYEAEKKGINIDKDKLSEKLGIEVVETVANRAKGIDELLTKTVKNKNSELNNFVINYGDKIENYITKIIAVLEDAQIPEIINKRWVAIKMIEKDPKIYDLLEKEISNKKLKKLKRFVAQKELKEENELEIIIINKKYEFINNLITKTVTKNNEKEKNNISDKIDKFVTNKYLGIPIFLLIMWGMFKFTFTLGDPLIGYIEKIFEISGNLIGEILLDIGVPPLISSFITDGITTL